jgi:pimeloyl-ACP methyl ester carboxylesterase
MRVPLVSFVLASSLLMTACSNPPYVRGSLETLYPAPPRPVLEDLTVEGRNIHYARMAGADAGPRIVFIHGSPGDWQAYAKYLARPELQKFGPLIAVDRPGYGGSDAHQMVPALADQARLLSPLLDDPHGPVIVVGHSLGGPIAAKLAMDYPDKVRGVLMIAGSVDPELEYPRWYNRAARYAVVRWLIPRELSDSNLEIYGLQAELKAMEPGWATLHAPVTVVQGMKDELVDPRTADYVDQQLAGKPHTVIRVPDIGHFVIWQRMDIVVKALTDLIDQTAMPLPAASPRP